MTDTPDDDWFQVNVQTADPAQSVGAVVRYKDYDAQLMDDGVLSLVLADRRAVFLFAPGQWQRLEARPMPEGEAP